MTFTKIDGTDKWVNPSKDILHSIEEQLQRTPEGALVKDASGHPVPKQQQNVELHYALIRRILQRATGRDEGGAGPVRRAERREQACSEEEGG